MFLDYLNLNIKLEYLFYRNEVIFNSNDSVAIFFTNKMSGVKQNLDF